jgi:hypothetical protein
MPGSAQPAPKPTDPQIAHIAYTAGDIDLKNAKLALEKSRNKDVRGFADDMAPCVREVAAQIGSETRGRRKAESGSIRTDLQRPRGGAAVAAGEFGGEHRLA